MPPVWCSLWFFKLFPRMFQIYIVGILRASLHYGKNYGSSRLWFQWNIFHKVYNVCVCKSFPQCDAQCIQLEDFSPVWGIISHKFSSICCSNATTIWLNLLGPLMSCNWQCCSSVFSLKRGALVSDAQKLSKQNHNREGRVHHRFSYILQCKDITPSHVSQQGSYPSSSWSCWRQWQRRLIVAMYIYVTQNVAYLPLNTHIHI